MHNNIQYQDMMIIWALIICIHAQHNSYEFSSTQTLNLNGNNQYFKVNALGNAFFLIPQRFGTQLTLYQKDQEFKLAQTITTTNSNITGVGLSPDERWMSLSYFDIQLHQYNYLRQQYSLVKQLSPPNIEKTLSVDMNNGATTVVIGCQPGKIYIYTGSSVGNLAVSQNFSMNDSVTSVHLSHNESFIVAKSYANEINVYKYSSDNGGYSYIQSVNSPYEVQLFMDVSSDASVMATYDNALQEISVYSNSGDGFSVQFTIADAFGQVYDVDVSDNGKWVLVCAQSIFVYYLENGNLMEVQTISGSFTGCSIDQDGKVIILGQANKLSVYELGKSPLSTGFQPLWWVMTITIFGAFGFILAFILIIIVCRFPGHPQPSGRIEVEDGKGSQNRNGDETNMVL